MSYQKPTVEQLAKAHFGTMPFRITNLEFNGEESTMSLSGISNPYEEITADIKHYVGDCECYVDVDNAYTSFYFRTKYDKFVVHYFNVDPEIIRKIWGEVPDHDRWQTFGVSNVL